MLTEEKIRDYVKKFKDLNLKDILLLIDMASIKKLKAGETYIEVGSNMRKLAYIQKGLLRAYGLKENGEEVSVWLRWEDQFLTAYDPILFKRSSRFTYVAMEDSLLLEVDYDKFMNTLRQKPQYSQAKDYFIFEILADVVKHRDSFLLMSAEERYLALLQQQPSIMQRVADKHIATYLGITPVSLSRIKKRLTKK